MSSKEVSEFLTNEHFLRNESHIQDDMISKFSHFH